MSCTRPMTLRAVEHVTGYPVKMLLGVADRAGVVVSTSMLPVRRHIKIGSWLTSKVLGTKSFLGIFEYLRRFPKLRPGACHCEPAFFLMPAVRL
jgi:hypothetical protein